MKPTTTVVLLGAASIGMMAVMLYTGAPLKTAITPGGILNLEFASTTSAVESIVGAWKNNQPNLIPTAILNTNLDFIFLLCYTLFLFHGGNYFAGRYHGWWQLAGKGLAQGAFVAGLLDVAENTGMLYALNGNLNSTVHWATSCCATIKWILALMALLYVLISLLGLAFGWQKRNYNHP